MPVGVPPEVAGDLEQGGLGQVRGPHELVAGFLVLGLGEVLHELADHAPLGVEHRQTPADLGREVEQVELRPEAAVIALFSASSRRCRWSSSAALDSHAVP